MPGRRCRLRRDAAAACASRSSAGAYLARILPANARGDPVKRFRYRDHGSLISLGHAGAVGSLMGFVRGKSFRIQGLVASFMYWSLYRSHRMALHGFWKTALDTVNGWLRRPTYPRVKLH